MPPQRHSYYKIISPHTPPPPPAPLSYAIHHTVLVVAISCKGQVGGGGGGGGRGGGHLLQPANLVRKLDELGRRLVTFLEQKHLLGAADGHEGPLLEATPTSPLVRSNIASNKKMVKLVHMLVCIYI